MPRLFRIVDRHVFSQLVGPFVFGILGALIIIAFGPMHRAITTLVAGKVPPAIVADWFVHRVPEDMQFIFPVATLMAGLLGFARLSKDGELTAMRAAGISLLRLLVPVLVFGVTASTATYFFLDRMVPPSMVHSQDLWVKHFRNWADPTYKENFTLKTKGNRLISVGKILLKDPDPGQPLLFHFALREYTKKQGEGPIPGPLLEIVSLSSPQVAWDAPRGLWILKDAREDRYESGRLVTRSHPRYELKLEETPAVFQAQDRGHQELTSRQLLAKIRHIEARGLGNTNELRVELYLRSSFPFCVLLFAVLGAVMGITNARAGGFMGFAVALLLTFLYYVTMSLSASMGKTGTLDPLLSAWMHNLLFAAVTARQAWRASSG